MNIGDVVFAVSPYGEEFRLRFDGHQDFTPLPAGIQEQYTALEEIPGLAPMGGTTYTCVILGRGFIISFSRGLASVDADENPQQSLRMQSPGPREIYARERTCT